MKKQLLHFILYAIIIYLTCSALTRRCCLPASRGSGTHFHGVIDDQWNKRDVDQFANRHARTATANLNVGEPRTVRLIYFLPNDRPYDADVVQKMKDEIRTVQNFFAEQMRSHGYGDKTFRVETDSQGEPMVHRVDGQYPNNHYNTGFSGNHWLDPAYGIARDEIAQTFNFYENIYVVLIDIGKGLPGTGEEIGNGGQVLIFSPIDEKSLFNLLAHELGHAFGLPHDFRDGSFLMSYGPGSRDRLSVCHTEFLAAHPYFNPDTAINDLSDPTIKLISPYTYPADAKSIPIRLQVSDPEGLHQAILYTAPYNGPTILTNDTSVKACVGLKGQKETVINFDYDGIVPFVHNPSYSRSNSVVHPIRVDVVDTSGNITQIDFFLFADTLEPLSKVSGDNLQGLPNTPLPVPFVVELWDLNGGFVRRGVWVTFTVTAGGGRLSVERVKTDDRGRAYSTLTLGPNFGKNTVKVSAAGLTVTFNAVAVAPVDIPDANLRAAIEDALDKAPGTPIAPAEMATLPRLDARNANITDLTGLAHATNLTELYLGAEWVEAERNWKTSNSVSNLSPLSGLTNLIRLDLRGNSISDLSPLTGLINLTWLELWDNHISDLSPLSGLTNLTELRLGENSVSNLSPLTGLTNLATLLLQRNPISDLSPLAGLTNLTRLGVARNNISDLSPLARLTKLTTLGLRRNRISDLSSLAGLTNLAKVVLISNSISDLSPLVANTGLGSGDEVVLNDNPLSYSAIKTHIPDLQSRGVKVESDNRAHSALLKISGDNQRGASFVSLSQPFVVEAQDANGSALAEVSVTFVVTAGGGMLSTTTTRTDPNGRAQSTLILGPNLGRNRVEVSAAGIESPATFYAIADSELSPTIADVNSDGSVNILDLILIASRLGQSGQNDADVNGDGGVNIMDLLLAAGMFEEAAAAPSAQPQVPETLTAVEIRGWLTDAMSLQVKDPIMNRGIVVLEQLLVSLTPTETELLANYPNPFNPETWIPYRLAEDAFVTLTIYNLSGHVVRTLEIGHRIASAYENRSKAIYWDGRNSLGEQVASGVYFYHLSAGDYSATRKMVILK